MRIELAGIVVEDQARALAFYTEKLGFRKKHDIPMGEFRWLTVVSPEQPEGPELALEPNAHPASQTWQQALKKDGIPATALAVDDIVAEHRRLEAAGVHFTSAPKLAGDVMIVTLDDTCGNLIQLYERV